MPWNLTSPLCQSLYGALDDNEQFDRKSTDISIVATLRMEDIQFYNTAASDAANRFNAEVLARNLDESLINTYAGTYQAGKNSATAQAAMLSVMTNATNTVTNLADAIAAQYSF